jgi:homogentisate 1,2-dioxygenase
MYDFMSRNNIEVGHITLHPKGISWTSQSNGNGIGHKETHELAVMVDTFRPLMVTEEAMGLTTENIINLGWNNNKRINSRNNIM